MGDQQEKGDLRSQGAAVQGSDLSATGASVVLRMKPDEARAAHHALATTISLMDQVGDVPPDAPLYGWRDGLAALARRLDHEINHAPGGRRYADPGGFNPLGGAARGIGRCSCPAGRGTDPGCPVHP
jgi:hypothetical protein